MTTKIIAIAVLAIALMMGWSEFTRSQRDHDYQTAKASCERTEPLVNRLTALGLSHQDSACLRELAREYPR